MSLARLGWLARLAVARLRTGQHQVLVGPAVAAPVSNLDVAWQLQQGVNVAVLHALQERADLVLAEDQRRALRIPGIPYRHRIAWQLGPWGA
jgi:hypothetical protein